MASLSPPALTVLAVVLFSLSACGQAPVIIEPAQTVKDRQEAIILEHLKQGAWKHDIGSRGWFEEIDKGLAKDSTIAYLWQQKAMPMVKNGKWQAAMPYLDKAVQYDPLRWQGYRAFIKCTFARDYRGAIEDFKDCRSKFGNAYVMDHSTDFFIALSHLQLTNYEEAERILRQDRDSLLRTRDDSWLHHLDIFYHGIAFLEMGEYEKAIDRFDHALRKYPRFSDAQYYKAKCLKEMGRKEESEELMRQARENGLAGYTINDDNVVYERFPYQVRWH